MWPLHEGKNDGQNHMGISLPLENICATFSCIFFTLRWACLNMVTTIFKYRNLVWKTKQRIRYCVTSRKRMKKERKIMKERRKETENDYKLRNPKWKKKLWTYYCVKKERNERMKERMERKQNREKKERKRIKQMEEKEKKERKKWKISIFFLV